MHEDPLMEWGLVAAGGIRAELFSVCFPRVLSCLSIPKVAWWWWVVAPAVSFRVFPFMGSRAGTPEFCVAGLG